MFLLDFLCYYFYRSWYTKRWVVYKSDRDFEEVYVRKDHRESLRSDPDGEIFHSPQVENHDARDELFVSRHHGFAYDTLKTIL